MPFATEQQFVVRAEEALGRRFPESYVARMLQSNGGSVEIDDDEWLMHPVRDDSDRKRLARSANDVVAETTVAKQWTGFPASAVAIGANGSGDFLILLPADNDRFGEAVFVWEHETGEVRQVADSLSALP